MAGAAGGSTQQLRSIVLSEGALLHQTGLGLTCLISSGGQGEPCSYFANHVDTAVQAGFVTRAIV